MAADIAWRWLCIEGRHINCRPHTLMPLRHDIGIADCWLLFIMSTLNNVTSYHAISHANIYAN